MTIQTTPQAHRGRPRAFPSLEAKPAFTSRDPEAVEIAVEAIRLFAETHPRPSHVTQVQAAEMLHVSRATVNRLVKTGHLKLNTLGMIPIAEVDRVLVAR